MGLLTKFIDESPADTPEMPEALLRMAVVWNIPIACNRASADFMISSPLMDGKYDRLIPDYEGYRTRKIDRAKAQDEASGTIS